METYLNIAFFSNQCYGIQSASKLYFNKDISELNVAEAATLIAITNAPTKYNPLRMNANEDYGWRTGMEENKERRDYILEEMYKLQMLTQSEYQKWLDYDVQLAPRKDVESTSDGLTALTDWHTDQVIEDVVTDLQQEYNYTPRLCDQNGIQRRLPDLLHDGPGCAEIAGGILCKSCHLP